MAAVKDGRFDLFLMTFKAVEGYVNRFEQESQPVYDTRMHTRSACPHHVQVRPMLAMAHDNLINPVT